MSPALLTALAASLLVCGLYEVWRAPRRRTAHMLRRADAAQEGAPDEAPLRALARWLLTRAQPWLPSSQQEQLKEMLLWAGQPLGLSADEFLFGKFVAAALGALVVWLPSLAGASNSPGLLLIGSAVGYILPERLLKMRIDERTRLIRIDLPHFVHLLATAVEAGLPMVEAVRRVAAEAPGLLAAEMLRTVQEMAAGKPVGVAWQHLASRTNCPELKEVLTGIIQSQELGVGVADQLRFQMKAIRARKQAEANEKAQAAAVQMKIPTILFIVAPTMVIILGPVFIAVLRAFKGG